MTSNLTLLRAANDDVPIDDAGNFVTGVDGEISRDERHPYRVPKAGKWCSTGYAARLGKLPDPSTMVNLLTIGNEGERDLHLKTGRAPTPTERINTGKVSPLSRAFQDGRIPSDLAIYAEKVEKAYRIATGHGGTRSPLEVAPGVLIGSEINANAAGVCRLVKYRCGPLYDVLIGACVHDSSMAEIGLEFFNASRLDKGEKAKVGTSKVIDALRLAKTAIDDMVMWEDEESRRETPMVRLKKALCADGFPDHWHEAANENVRRLGPVAA